MNRVIHYLFMAIIYMSAAFQPGYSYKKIKVYVLEPPAYLLVGVEQIAVIDFEGKAAYGRLFSDYLVSQLLENNRGIGMIRTGFLGMSKKEGVTLQKGVFTNVFKVLERSRLEKVLSEQQLGLTGLMDQSQAVQVGKLLGVQALITGSIHYSSQDGRKNEQRTRKRNGKKETYTVTCQTRQVEVKTSLRVISTSDGEILASFTPARTLKEKHCPEQEGALPTVQSMVESGLQQIAVETANSITPHFVYREFEFEKIKTNKFKKIAERAAKRAENLDVDQAYLLYKSLYDQDPYNPKLLYNLGILHEVVGNIQKAAEFYQMAAQLKDEKKYRKAVQRIEKSAAFSELLSALGIELQEHEFRASEAAKAQVLAQKIVIKGSSEDRIPIFSEPREGSAVVTRVPGGLQFRVKARQGDWYLLELLGGKEGYLHKNRVK